MRDEVIPMRRELDETVQAAETAFETYSRTTGADRAAFLRNIAEKLEAATPLIVQTAMAETALPEPRLQGEMGRTTGQLRMFADLADEASFPETIHVPADPTRAPAPRPGLRLVHRPVGPVAVFGASNFPLAFSVAGGDTASALAAGCSVVVKAHTAHPETSVLVADQIRAAALELSLPAGVFGMISGEGNEIGLQLVRHPLISAVGFTGSLRGGRALFDLCAARANPIPFFGELGSINPVFVLPEALQKRGDAIAEAWVNSLTLGVGQFCTNPGLLVLPEGPAAEAFIKLCVKSLGKVAPQPMLTPAIAENFRRGVVQIEDLACAEICYDARGEGRNAGPVLMRMDAADWIAKTEAQEEVFGPFGLVVIAPPERFIEIARALHGQLTATLHFEPTEEVDDLVATLERKAGRLLANDFPTGVEVSEAMIHGGPYPASTNFGATSVGTKAIDRWLRCVCYQNFGT